MNTIGIGTKIPASTQTIIDARPGINPINAHKLAVKWARRTAKGLAHTAGMRDILATDLVETPGAEDLQDLGAWIATN